MTKESFIHIPKNAIKINVSYIDKHNQIYK